MNKIRNYLNPPVAALLLGLFLGALWAYALSREDLEIKNALRKDPAANFAAALTYIASRDGGINPKEYTIIQSVVNQKYNIKDEAQQHRIQQIIESGAISLELPEIIRNFKKSANADIDLLINVGMILIADNGIIRQESGAVTDIMNYAGIKADNDW